MINKQDAGLASYVLDDGGGSARLASQDSELLAAIRWYGDCVYQRAKGSTALPYYETERAAWDDVCRRLSAYVAVDEGVVSNESIDITPTVGVDGEDSCER